MTGTPYGFDPCVRINGLEHSTIVCELASTDDDGNPEFQISGPSA